MPTTPAPPVVAFDSPRTPVPWLLDTTPHKPYVAPLVFVDWPKMAGAFEPVTALTAIPVPCCCTCTVWVLLLPVKMRGLSVVCATANVAAESRAPPMTRERIFMMNLLEGNLLFD